MSSQECVTINVAMAGTMTFVALLTIIDCFVRDIPANVVKARVVLFLFEGVKVAQAATSGRLDNAPTQAWLMFLYITLLMTMLLYFMENFIVVWISLVSRGEKPLPINIESMERIFLACRLFGVVYSLSLGIAFSIRPTNAVIVAAIVGRCISWSYCITTSTIVAYLARLLRKHRTHLEQQGTVSPKHFAMTERHMLVFIAINTTAASIMLALEAGHIRELRSILDEPWQPDGCIDVSTEVIRHVGVLGGVLLLRAPNAKRKSAIAKSSGRNKSNMSTGSDQMQASMKRSSRKIDVSTHRNSFDGGEPPLKLSGKRKSHIDLDVTRCSTIQFDGRTHVSIPDSPMSV